VHLEGLDHALGDVVLDLQDVGRGPIVALRREGEPPSHVGHLDRHPQAISRPPHASLEDRAHAETLPDLPNVEGGALELERGRSRGHAQAAQAHERVDQLVGQAVAEVLLVPLRAEVGEGKDGQRVDGRRFVYVRVDDRRLVALDRTQLRRHLPRRGEASRRVLLQAPEHDACESRWNALREGRRRLRQHGREDLGYALAGERRGAAEHFVGDASQREDVAASVGGFATGLLRGHVGNGADEGAGQRLPGEGRRVGRRVRGGQRHGGQTEVQDLHAAVGGEEHVGRLQVAVDDPARVGRGEPVRDRGGDLERFRPRDGPPLEPRPQGLTREELGDREEDASLEAHVVDRDDVWMGESGHGARLAGEAPPGRLVGAQLLVDRLDRHLAAQPRVEGPVHLSHPTGAEEREDLVGAGTAAGGERHGGVTPRGAASRPAPDRSLRAPRSARLPRGEGAAGEPGSSHDPPAPARA
jgi:hypothetical protein